MNMTLTNYWWLLIWLFTGGIVLAVIFSQNTAKWYAERWKQDGAVVPAVLMAVPYIVWAGYQK